MHRFELDSTPMSQMVKFKYFTKTSQEQTTKVLLKAITP